MIELRPATLETVKPLRLRALREDPDAFGSTLAEEQGRPGSTIRTLDLTRAPARPRRATPR